MRPRINTTKTGACPIWVGFFFAVGASVAATIPLFYGNMRCQEGDSLIDRALVQLVTGCIHSNVEYHACPLLFD